MASHLSLEEREIIAHMKHDGKSRAQIAERLRRAESTISRELKRNRCRNGYWAVAAQKKAEARRRDRPWTCKFDRPALRKYVCDRLRQCGSPDEDRVSFSPDACIVAGNGVFDPPQAVANPIHVLGLGRQGIKAAVKASRPVGTSLRTWCISSTGSM